MSSSVERLNEAGVSSVPTPSLGPLAVRGKFFADDHQKVYLRGVTYGPFAPKQDSEYHTPNVVQSDFESMYSTGINTIRVYTVPPTWLLDLAYRYGLRVMVGIPWEQHVAFLDSRASRRSIQDRIKNAVKSLADHPAIQSIVVGNEIPAPIVRWYGRVRIEKFIRRLYLLAKEEAPETLVTYVNYPTTEYLQLDFLDFCCFNVYLESREELTSYLWRLQNIAEERPLVMAEIGLDSHRNGLGPQADTLDWQIRAVYEAGCAGAFVFSWTDEWHRGGHEILDWDFGLTDRSRRPKPALAAVQKAFEEIPCRQGPDWPRFSVIVCAYNAGDTLADCLTGLAELDYPNYEVIVVDDGSTDSTAAIAKQFDVRLIRSKNGGLSRARNLGLRMASGSLVAYIDSDAFPDPDWLSYLALHFLRSEHAAIGGPNIHPGTENIADCVAKAPGNPNHVLLTDEVAEHIPGCNMAFRTEALRKIGGFDTRFRIAGDDVDLCWRIQRQGWTIGFHPGAMVWHYCRETLRAYWKQQTNYGRAEAILEGKWPEKYNRFGHVVWQGSIYGPPRNRHRLFGRWRVYSGTWGSHLFQSIYAPAPSNWKSFLLMPEWVLGVLLLALGTGLGVLWKPLLVILPVFLLAAGAFLVHAGVSASDTGRIDYTKSKWHRFSKWLCVTILHILQPTARLVGRVHYDLHPLARRGATGWSLPIRREFTHWSEKWASLTDWQLSVENRLHSYRLSILRGGAFDRWDLEAWCGFFGGVRILMTAEEHGSGRQLLRVRTWPKYAWKTLWLLPFVLELAILAALGGALLPAALLALLALFLVLRSLLECSAAMYSVARVVRDWGKEEG